MAVGVGFFAVLGIFGSHFFFDNSGSMDWGDRDGSPAHGTTSPGPQPHAGVRVREVDLF